MQEQSKRGADSNIIGRKSEMEDRQAASQAKRKRKRPRDRQEGPPTEAGGVKRFTKSSAVFGMLQDRRGQDGKEGTPKAGGRGGGGGKASSAWKL